MGRTKYKVCYLGTNVKYYTLYILLLFFVFIRSIFMYKFYLLFVLLTLILLY